jgi:hypothetical protein|tara:strand:+ start:113 stop:787 length:675 start_codon:yes stop_codon:yes gene_type:complete
MKFLTKTFKTTANQEDVIIPAALDNLTTAGITKGVITLFGEVARAAQITQGANAAGWAQTVQTVNNLALADRMQSISLIDTVTIKNSVDTIVSNGAGNVVNQATIETFSGGIPSNFATSNSIIRNSYDILIPEKKFYSNTQSNTANVDNFNSYVLNQLNNNAVYANANVTTSVQYAINNGYTEDWTTLNSSSFDVSMNTLDVQDLAELNIARIKTSFLNNNYFG